jgi:hypothetical protein
MVGYSETQNKKCSMNFQPKNLRRLPDLTNHLTSYDRYEAEEALPYRLWPLKIQRLPSRRQWHKRR